MRIRELLIVEGKYDAARLSGLVDGLILTTDGFSIRSANGCQLSMVNGSIR